MKTNKLFIEHKTSKVWLAPPITVGFRAMRMKIREFVRQLSQPDKLPKGTSFLLKNNIGEDKSLHCIKRTQTRDFVFPPNDGLPFQIRCN